MIRKLQHREIDFTKYAEALQNSAQYRYSSTLQYLEITAGKNWELLVMGDYEAVMPVPFTKKIGFKVVDMPRLCQQLGIFSEVDSEETNGMFRNFLIKNYPVAYYAFNQCNRFSEPLPQRQNFRILPAPYEEIFRNYAANRKRQLKNPPLDTEISPVDFASALPFASQYLKGVESPAERQLYLEIFRQFAQEDALKIYRFTVKGEVANLLMVYGDPRTAVLLGVFNHPERSKFGGAAILADFVIQKECAHKIIDFEGGNIPGIAEFFRRFGADSENYAVINNSKKNILKALASAYISKMLKFIGFKN